MAIMEVKRCLAFAAAIAAFASCQIEDPFIIEDTPVFEKSLVFSASDFKSDETLDTRTDIAPGGGFLWSANDTVGIFPNSGSQVYFAMTSGAGAGSATFDGGGWDFKPSAVYRSDTQATPLRIALLPMPLTSVTRRLTEHSGRAVRP